MTHLEVQNNVAYNSMNNIYGIYYNKYWLYVHSHPAFDSSLLALTPVTRTPGTLLGANQLSFDLHGLWLHAFEVL